MSKRLRLRARERAKVVAAERARQLGNQLGFDAVAVDQYKPCRNPTGYAEFDDGEGFTVRADLLNCPHCGDTFAVHRDARSKFCHACDAQTCGRPCCEICTGPSTAVARFGRA